MCPVSFWRGHTYDRASVLGCPEDTGTRRLYCVSESMVGDATEFTNHRSRVLDMVRSAAHSLSRRICGSQSLPH